jgi:mycothiol system anti-sigma-R factor
MSHNCDKAKALAYRYLDGEMVWFRRLRLQWHLRHCPPCEQSFRFEAWLKQRVREDCREEMPTAVYERLRVVLSEFSLGDPSAR